MLKVDADATRPSATQWKADPTAGITRVPSSELRRRGRYIFTGCLPMSTRMDQTECVVL